MGKPQHNDDKWVKRVVSMSYRYGWVVIEGEKVRGYSVGSVKRSVVGGEQWVVPEY
jgi:hypothetical protein